MGEPSPNDTPLSEVLENLPGDDAQFGLLDGGVVRCFTCRHTFLGSNLRSDNVTRLEGASDPADMVMVIPAVCPKCGASGGIVVRYGPAASEAESDLLLAAERRPTVGPPGSQPTPGVE